MKIKPEKSKKTILYGAVFAVFAGGMLCLYLYTSIFLFTPKAQYKRLGAKIEAAAERNDWHRVLDLCNIFLELMVSDLEKGRITQENVGAPWYRVNVHTKYALILTGQLLENFFSYNRYQGFNHLIPEQENFIFLLPSAHRFFSAIELQALALASAFNRFETTENPAALNDFIESSILVGDYRTPETFINRLEQYRKWRRQARKYRELLADTAKINADPYYIARRSMGPKEDFFVWWNIDRSITSLHFSNPYNQRAFEYTLMFALLNNLDYYFSEIETLLTRFDYDHIPRHLEEAILMISGYGWNPEVSQNLVMTQTFGGLTIRPETIFRHERLVQHFNMLQQGQLAFDWFASTYQDTYQLYFLNMTLSQ
jgi:hypothetical protein